MLRDSTKIPSESDCIALMDSQTLFVYNDTTKDTYKLFSNTWEKTLTETGTPPGNTVCYSLTQIQELQSPFDFITPIYHALAITSALLIFYAAYKLIIHPFFRIKL